MSTGSDVPTLQQLNAYVKPLMADVWYLALEADVKIIKVNNPTNASGACTEMFSLWLQKNPSVTWNSLISIMKEPGIDRHDVANKIEQMLQPGNVNVI